MLKNQTTNIEMTFVIIINEKQVFCFLFNSITIKKIWIKIKQKTKSTDSKFIVFLKHNSSIETLSFIFSKLAFSCIFQRIKKWRFNPDENIKEKQTNKKKTIKMKSHELCECATGTRNAYLSHFWYIVIKTALISLLLL